MESYIWQVLALMQVHPKESLGRVIHDSKVVRCLKMRDIGFISTLCHCYLSVINWIMPNLHVVIPIDSVSSLWGMWAAPKNYLMRIDWLLEQYSSQLNCIKFCAVVQAYWKFRKSFCFCSDELTCQIVKIRNPTILDAILHFTCYSI